MTPPHLRFQPASAFSPHCPDLGTPDNLSSISRGKRCRPSQEVELQLQPVDTLTSALFARLLDWLSALHDLHRACKDGIPSEVCVLAMGVFRDYVAASGCTQQYAVLQPLVTNTVLAVCLWSAIKFLSTPGCVPSALYMAHVTGVHSKMLVSFEPEVLRVVDWNLLAVCRRMNMQAPPEEQEPLELKLDSAEHLLAQAGF